MPFPVRKQFYIPLYLIIGFNLFTVVAFITAPFNMDKGKPLLVVLYLIVNYLFIILGYLMGIKKSKHKYFGQRLAFSNLSQNLIIKIFTFYTFTFLIKYAYLLRFEIFDIKGMFSYLLAGFYNPQLGYALSINDTRSFTVSWGLYTVISIINQIFFIFGFLSWYKLNKYFKIIFVFFVLVEIFYWIGRGTGFGVTALITTLFFSILAVKKVYKINLRIVFFTILLFSVGIGVFGFLKKERAGGKELSLQVFDQRSNRVNENHYIFNIIPQSLTQTYMHSISYMTQGYYALGLGFECDFSSCYFLGNNPASINIANTFGLDLWKKTYMWKLYQKEGIDDHGKWHSAYLWYANDVSIMGVPFILLLIAYFTGFAYALILRHDDLLSKIIFVILLNMLVYLFANNSFLAQYYYSFVVIFILWFLTRVKIFKLTYG